MKEFRLTVEQQRYAADHHGLVHTFLKKKGLSYDKFYDVVVFGYLKAVTEYLSNPLLRKEYKFSTIAFQKMADALYRHYEQQNRLKRKAITISLDATIYRNEEPQPLGDVLGTPDSGMIDLETKLLLLDLASIVSKKTMNVIHLAIAGYGVKDIAQHQSSSIDDIKDILANAKDVVISVCKC